MSGSFRKAWVSYRSGRGRSARGGTTSMDTGMAASLGEVEVWEGSEEAAFGKDGNRFDDFGGPGAGACRPR